MGSAFLSSLRAGWLLAAPAPLLAGAPGGWGGFPALGRAAGSAVAVDFVADGWGVGCFGDGFGDGFGAGFGDGCGGFDAAACLVVLAVGCVADLPADLPAGEGLAEGVAAASTSPLTGI